MIRERKGGKVDWRRRRRNGLKEEDNYKRKLLALNLMTGNYV